MGYRAMFVIGFAAGFVAGTRAGRERYDQMVKYGRQVAGSPGVQKATVTIREKTTQITKTAAAKAPELAKSVGTQVPKIAKSAKEKAAAKSPSRHAKGHDGDEQAADGQLVYPSEDSQSSVNGARYSP